MNRILIVEDEFSISNFMKTVLEGDGYAAEVATCAAQARAALAKEPFAAMLLDLGLPDADGMELLQELRQRYGLPVIVVSARTEESDKVAALDCGADDYITKPFGSPELLARIRAALRRAGPAAQEPRFTVGELTIDYEKHLVTLAGQPVHLTAGEYRLVELLSRHAGRVLTYDRISEAMWGDAAGGNSQLLRVNMANIRRKLEQNPAEPQYILTEIGVGHRMPDALGLKPQTEKSAPPPVGLPAAGRLVSAAESQAFAGFLPAAYNVQIAVAAATLIQNRLGDRFFL